ncbi:hypothetical protein [Luethyella okanaganae]|uniref:EcsC family protein n=1 Tax=Luethyella okanaganae TaxID=69372 RepID=A0ABW1VAT3_9MICO
MARKTKPIISETGGTPKGGELPHPVVRGIDRVMAVHRPVVLSHIRVIRRRNPTATPEQIVRILERRYLAAVTTGGAAVGATAVVPGIGTGVTLALSGVETAGFLEATALFAQSVAEVHGISVDDPERARALVMTLMLGREGSDLVRQLAAQFGGGGVVRHLYWGELITSSLPAAVVGPLADRLKTAFIRQFAARGGASFLAKAVPFGIGAAIGGVGNNILGRRVLRNSRVAFGYPPPAFRLELDPRPREITLRGSATRRVTELGRTVGRGVGTAVQKALPRGMKAADVATDAQESDQPFSRPS